MMGGRKILDPPWKCAACGVSVTLTTAYARSRARKRGYAYCPLPAQCRFVALMGHPVSLKTRAKLSAIRKARGYGGVVRHGHCEGGASPTYVSWTSMWTRTTNSRSVYFKNYGARGITVEDPRWKDFANFLDDMGVRPAGRSLDRIDNERGYCKENCRWATRSEQRRNSRSRVTRERPAESAR